MDGAPRKKQWLILLALFQLVAGPLVLLQVMVFCQVTAEKAPEQGIVKAAAEAWHSAEFQRTLDVAANLKRQDQPLPGTPEKTFQPETKKIFGTLWEPLSGLVRPHADPLPGTELRRGWTPVCQSAPPGPPPRVA